MATIYKRIHQLETELALSLSHNLAVDKSDQGSARKILLSELSDLIVAIARSYNINNVSNANYNILDGDGYNEINIDPATENRTAKFPDPTATVNLNRKLKIRNGGDGSYKVLLAPFAAETFNVMSGNEEWTLTSFELLQAGDWAEFISDGTNWIKCNEPYWHKFDNPATGTKFSKTDAWTADSFSSGIELTYSEAPIGSLAVRNVIAITGTTGGETLYYRKSGDTNISNTPDASTEYSHRVIYVVAPATPDWNTGQFVLYLSDDLKVQIASRFTTLDLFVFYPIEYLQ